MQNPKEILKNIGSLLKETFDGFSAANGTLLAAALAYYTIFSLAPLLMIAVSFAGMVFGQAAVINALMDQISLLASPEIAATIENAIINFSTNPDSGAATVISIIIIVIGASILFVQLKRAINFLWGIVPQEGKGIIIMIQSHFLSFLMVLLIGLMVLAAMTLGTIMVFLGHLAEALPIEIQNGFPQANFGFMVALFAGLFAITFKVLPDAHIAWKDVLMGATVTSLLFTFGEYLIGFYLRFADLGSAYGTASSIVVLLVWIYYSMQIVLLGAKFTQVYANRFGSQVLPTKRAELFVRKRIKKLTPEK